MLINFNAKKVLGDRRVTLVAAQVHSPGHLSLGESTSPGIFPFPAQLHIEVLYWAALIYANHDLLITQWQSDESCPQRCCYCSRCCCCHCCWCRCWRRSCHNGSHLRVKLDMPLALTSRSRAVLLTGAHNWRFISNTFKRITMQIWGRERERGKGLNTHFKVDLIIKRAN